MKKTSKDKKISINRKRKRNLVLIYCIVFFAFSTLVFKITKDAVTKIWEASSMSSLGNKTQSNLPNQENSKEKNSLSLQDKKNWNLILANPSTALPEDFTVDLAQLSNGHQIDNRAYNDLQNMMDDARNEGLAPMICSSYRTMDSQQQLFNQEVSTYIVQGYSQGDAKKQAAQWVAVPGTSEHQTGLALDIVSSSYQLLNKDQENTPEQKWLIENSYKYGFILRYPSDKTHITGIEYEPWHYRYVGKDAAKESKETEPQELLKYADRPIVCIDAGHGGYDVGAMTSSNVYEKDITIKVALEVGKILDQNQINVVYTRTSDEVPWPSNESDDLLKRIDISNSKNADVFVSIHCNFFEDSSVKGVESWCRFPNSEGEYLAKNIQNKLASVNYTTDRRIKYESDSEIRVIRLNNAVSTLVELGYLTNDSDTEFLLSTQGQAKCAKAIADGILEYLS